jgi:hypothetical protein
MDENDLVKAGAEAAMKPFASLIERLFGGAVDQVGGGWEDRVRVRREIRKLKLMKKLDHAIAEAGYEPRPIPDSIWIPAVQEALLQDDDALQEKWAFLLANAADPRQDNSVSPAFAVILKELTGREAKFLDALYVAMQFSQVPGVVLRRRFDKLTLQTIYEKVHAADHQNTLDLFRFSSEIL